MAKYGYTLRDFIYSVGKHNVNDVFIQTYFKTGNVKN